MLADLLHNYSIILATKSPRRHFLMKEAGIEYTLSDLHEVDENFPSGLDKFEIPVYLSELKSNAYNKALHPNEILITADTIVWKDQKVIGKPINREDALNILTELSGNMHEVITGVSIRDYKRIHSFHSHTNVYFDKLSKEELEFYFDKYNPVDKAGAYGIQEWIGYIGIKEIKGSYFNVMGLPVQKLYRELETFININKQI